MDLTYADLLPFAPTLTVEQADLLIRGVTARVAQKVPCILTLTGNDAARDILLVAVLRRHVANGGLVTSQRVGEVQIDIEHTAGTVAGRLLTSAELEELQALCGSAAYGPQYSFPDAQDWPDPVERRCYLP